MKKQDISKLKREIKRAEQFMNIYNVQYTDQSRLNILKLVLALTTKIK